MNVDQEDRESRATQDWRVATPEQIAEGLSGISKTYDGSSYAYTTLNISEKKFRSLGDTLRLFQHLRFLNVSKNDLYDISDVVYLPYLVEIDASSNVIESVSFLQNSPEALPYLRKLNLNKNKIKIVPRIPQASVKILMVSDNQVNQSCIADENGGQGLQEVDFSKNQLSKFSLLNLGQIQKLDLSENQITILEDTSNYSLTDLNLRKNKLNNLDGIYNIYYLKHINLSENLLASFEPFANIRYMNHLEWIEIGENPIAQEKEADLKKEFLVETGMRQVKKLNDEEITEEDKKDADETFQEREAEKKRKAEEEEAARLEALEAEKNAQKEAEGAENNMDDDVEV